MNLEEMALELQKLMLTEIEEAKYTMETYLRLINRLEEIKNELAEKGLQICTGKLKVLEEKLS